MAVAVLLVLAGGLLVWRLHAGLLAGLDTAAVRKALAVEATITGAAVPPIISTPGQGEAVQVIDSAGRVRAASPDIQGEPPIFATSAASPGAAAVVQTDHPEALGASEYRVAALTTRQAPHYRVYVGLSLDQVNRSTAVLVAALALGLPTLLGALASVTWVLTGRALHPVETLRRQAADITVTGLHRRVDVPVSADELSRLATTLNDLLARLDSAQRQQRQFVAEAAHELRSPVAAIRLQLETGGADDAAAHAVAVEQSVRLSRLVDDLLSLARLDARPELRRDEVDLDDVVRSEVAVTQPRPGLTIDTHGLRTVRLLGDEALLARLVRNLLDNAARYARALIVVTVHQEGPTVVLVVADDGPGVPPTDRERVFARFARLDDARSRDEGGVGLGLAIVRDVAVAHGGSVGIEDGAPGARMVVTLPTHTAGDAT